MARVHIDLINNSNSKQLPGLSDLELWATAAVGQQREEAEISLLIVDEAEGAELNQQWRNKNGPTNVLSFPSDLPAELGLPLLGDLVICAPVVAREALAQKKASAHTGHIWWFMAHCTCLALTILITIRPKRWSPWKRTSLLGLAILIPTRIGSERAGIPKPPTRGHSREDRGQ